MNNKKRKLKAIVLSMGLGVAMLSTNPVQAQMINLLDEYYDEMDQKNQNDGPLLRGSYTINDNTDGGIINDSFGAPLGSGIAILIGAGLGYVALKKKEDKQ